ncbi:hypothetical protein NEISUBOT_03765 [Neisseria subflava NJ9703]|uniref:Uncharacterized protein n=1 Tax=Neisseria subflava NJ9703 TaxID=546268 RepID=A0A9W5ISG1_NEISU|nr:hypothetical protein NEISUBOT_03765 [Neisseria subflava NJ9703]
MIRATTPVHFSWLATSASRPFCRLIPVKLLTILTDFVIIP